MSDDRTGDERDESATTGEPEPDEEDGEPRHHERRPHGYSRGAVLGSAVVGLTVAFLSVAWAAGNALFFEELFRTAPTVEEGGVGADWVAGNTIPALDFLVALVHAADVILGAFILLLLFVHWASFRRIAARMQAPGRGEPGEVAADGGPVTGASGASSGSGADGRAPPDEAADHDAADREGGDRS